MSTIIHSNEHACSHAYGTKFLHVAIIIIIGKILCHRISMPMVLTLKYHGHPLWYYDYEEIMLHEYAIEYPTLGKRACLLHI